MKHPWIKKYKEKRITRLGTKLIDRISTYGNENLLKKTIGHFIASRLNHNEIEFEARLFNELDKNKDGYLTYKELKKGLKGRMTDEQILEIMKNCDTD